jgi:hypothetical protein
VENFRLETTLTEDGTLILQHLPFHAGESVEVIIAARQSNLPAPADPRYPLRGLPYRYDNPTSPVAEDDWEANQ